MKLAEIHSNSIFESFDIGQSYLNETLSIISSYQDKSLDLVFEELSEEKKKKFISWFGNSKIKDRNKKPLRVFHGTPGHFDGDIFKVSKKGIYGPGIYFTSNPKFASDYALGHRRTGSGEPAEVKGQVIPVYLKMENPFSDGALKDDAAIRNQIIKLVSGGFLGGIKKMFSKKDEHQQEIESKIKKLKNNEANVLDVFNIYNILVMHLKNNDLAIKLLHLIRNKYDGVVANTTNKNGNNGAELVVWYPNQVKNAITLS